jgi:hypothetical protein
MIEFLFLGLVVFVVIDLLILSLDFPSGTRWGMECIQQYVIQKGSNSGVERCEKRVLPFSTWELQSAL